ncbi:hypothetical protein U5315_002802 [Vibrio fluvialis]|nr:hypothetical protein [Vibrio fluvialis]
MRKLRIFFEKKKTNILKVLDKLITEALHKKWSKRFRKTKALCSSLLYKLIVLETTTIYKDLTVDDALKISDDIFKSYLHPKKTSYQRYLSKHKLSLTQKIILERIKNNPTARLIYNFYHFSHCELWKNNGRFRYEILKIYKGDLEFTKKYTDKIVLISSKDIARELKKIDKNVSSRYKLILTERSEMRLSKFIGEIQLNFNTIFSIISLLSVSFFVSGMLYNTVFFNGLGIKASDIMSGSDYIYTSLSSIGIYFFTCALIFAMWINSAKIDLEEYFINKEVGVETLYKEGRLKLLAVSVMLAIVVWQYFHNDYVNYYLIPMICIYFYSKALDKIDICKYFKSPTLVFYIILTSMVLFTSVYIRAHEDIRKFHENKDRKSNLHIVFKKEYKNSYDEYSPLLITSQNLVMYNNKDLKSFMIIPKDRVEYYSYD